jgi:hypothetical protein
MTLILVRSIGVLVFCVIAAIAWMAFGKSVKAIPPKEPCQPQKPILAMEVLKTADRGLQLLGPPPAPGRPENEQRAAMRDQIQRDFFFILSYGLLFATMSLLLAQRPLRGAVWLGAVAGICAVAAALFDVRENLNILHFLSLSAPDDAAALAIRYAALAKWGLTAATVALLSALFFGRGHWLLTIVGVLFLATAAIGFAGLGCNQILERIFPPLALALLATAGVCLFRTDWLT